MEFKTKRKRMLIVDLLACMFSAQAAQAEPNTTSATETAKEELAYTLGTQAYVYGYPWIYLPTLRWLWVTKPINPERVPYAAINHFWSAKYLTDANYRDGGSPNNDTHEQKHDRRAAKPGSKRTSKVFC